LRPTSVSFRTAFQSAVLFLVIACFLFSFSNRVSAQAEFCTIDPVGRSNSEGSAFTVPAELHCPCPGSPSFVTNNDRGYEAALMWQGGGVAGKQAGVLAEPFETPGGEPGAVCFMLTWTYGTTSDTVAVDLLVWDDDGGQPGEVLGVVSNVDLGVIAPWPLGAQRNTDFDVEASIVPVEGKFWAGLRASSPLDSCSVLLGADLDGSGAMTYVAPDLGLPEGWQSVESIYGHDLSLALGIVIGGCTNPVLESSWGQIKALYKE